MVFQAGASSSTNLEDIPASAFQSSIRPDGSYAVDEAQLFASTFDLDFSSSSQFVSDYLTVDAIGLQLQITNTGYRLNVPSSATVTAFDEFGNVLNLAPGETSQVSTHTISTLAIPSTAGTLVTADAFDITSIAGSFAWLGYNYDVSVLSILFEDGSSGFVYPEAEQFYLQTTNGLRFNYRLSTNYLTVTAEAYGFAQHYSRDSVLTQYDVDYYLNQLTREDYVEIFESGLVVDGAYTDPISAAFAAVSMSNMDSNYRILKEDASRLKNFGDQFLENYQAQKDLVEKLAAEIAKMGPIGKIAAGMVSFQYEIATAIVGFAVEYSTLLVSTLRESHDAAIMIREGRWDEVGEWAKDKVLQLVEVYCNLAMNVFAAGASLLIAGWNYLKDVLEFIVGAALKPIWNAITSAITNALGKFDEWGEIFEADISDASISAAQLAADELAEAGVDPKIPPVNKGASTEMEDIARFWNWGETAIKFAQYIDYLNRARHRALYMTLHGIIWGSAIGFAHSLADVLGESDENQDFTATEEILTKKLVDNQVLEISEPLRFMGKSKAAQKAKRSMMEGLIKMFGFSLVYDDSYIGSGLAKPVENSYDHWDVIAKKDADNNWHYFLALEPDMKFPITLLSLMPAMGGMKKAIVQIIIKGLIEGLGEWDASFVRQTIEQGYVDSKTANDFSGGDRALLMIVDALRFIANFDFGLVMALGKEAGWGIQ
ncbi:MAG: hypothetical protein IH840_18200, partial [Candidatus Heimdallarchaeota archaeon]|nr:hypothetical protein [Candidatus Heimdallarchaeota archaeon]